jgi:hypothetical protein
VLDHQRPRQRERRGRDPRANHHRRPGAGQFLRLRQRDGRSEPIGQGALAGDDCGGERTQAATVVEALVAAG